MGEHGTMENGTMEQGTIGRLAENNKECVINEVLAYVTYYMSRATKNGIIAVIIAHFTMDELTKARDILDNYCSKLDLINYDKIPRKRHGGVKNTAVELIAKDITDVFTCIDENEGAWDTMPQFVARDISKIPKTAPEQMTSLIGLIEKMNVLENKLKFLEVTSSRQIDLCKGLIDNQVKTI